VAEECADAACKDRCQPRCLTCDRHVTDRIDPAVKGQQTSGDDPMLDRAPTDSRGQQLRSRHDSVLAARERPDQRVISRLSIHVMDEGERWPGSPPYFTETVGPGSSPETTRYEPARATRAA
jgi:hypothetical protein